MSLCPSHLHSRLITKRPSAEEELFNLCHAMLRSVVECIFGVLKRRFQIILQMPGFSFPVQVKLIYAVTALHNFISKEDNVAAYFSPAKQWQKKVKESAENDVAIGSESMGISTLRDKIAQDMWNCYWTIWWIKKISGHMSEIFLTNYALRVIPPKLTKMSASTLSFIKPSTPQM